MKELSDKEIDDALNEMAAMEFLELFYEELEELMLEPIDNKVNIEHVKLQIQLIETSLKQNKDE
jgi:hypothetical protein